MELDQVVEEIENSNEFDLERLEEHSIGRIGPLCDEVCANFRTLAGCAVLFEGDTDTFCTTLLKSGVVRRYYLKRCVEEDPRLRDPYRATGNGSALFDVLAARGFGLAREIAALSPGDWWEGEEYGEDFHYLNFFHRLLNDGADDPVVLAEIDLLEGVLEGTEDGKLGTCRALSKKDQRAFDEAFELLLDARTSEIENAEEAYTPYDALAEQVRSQVYIEGLAILNVADWLGLKTEEEYRLCPVIARLPAQRWLSDEPMVDGLP